MVCERLQLTASPRRTGFPEGSGQPGNENQTHTQKRRDGESGHKKSPSVPTRGRGWQPRNHGTLRSFRSSSPDLVEAGRGTFSQLYVGPVARASSGLIPPPFWMSIQQHRFIAPSYRAFLKRVPPRRNFFFTSRPAPAGPSLPRHPPVKCSASLPTGAAKPRPGPRPDATTLC